MRKHINKTYVLISPQDRILDYLTTYSTTAFSTGYDRNLYRKWCPPSNGQGRYLTPEVRVNSDEVNDSYIPRLDSLSDISLRKYETELEYSQNAELLDKL